LTRQKEVFDCQICGECCHGEGGIYLEAEKAPAAAALLGIGPAEFIARFTEPKYGMLGIKTGPDGFCLFHDRDRKICMIHAAKPGMCRDWPFFHANLVSPQAFEEAKQACPGIVRDATFEDFVAWHREKIGRMPPRSYIFDQTSSPKE
jgi:hypothetical protein